MIKRLVHLTARTVLVCAAVQGVQLCAPLFCHANDDGSTGEAAPFTVPAGPNKPIAPPAFRQPTIIDAYRCERRFLYKGMVFSCDSNVQRDAERLRPLMSDVPQALAELDTYQRNRQNVRFAAYAGSIGLITAFGGLLISRILTDQNGNPTATGTSLRNYALIGGLGLTGISLAYGLSILSTNESHIENAVRYHNRAHPDTPIELQFTTGFSF